MRREGVMLDLWIRFGYALLLGALIGLEREYSHKAAGLRTHMLVSLGSAIFTYFSLNLAQGGGDPTRIASQIVTGIGFLGGGVILRQGATVYGLTTAACIWATAAIGMGVGAGKWQESGIGAVLAVIILKAGSWLEDNIVHKA